ncbi:MAG TPA: tandem-95 repeat protein [Hyalangium sp.]|nr:tandem-95 repeat protein [Hyalangium sp.]
MHHRLPLSLVSLLFVGLGIVACGEDPAPSNRPPILTGPFVTTPDVTSGTPVEVSLEATDADGDSLTYEWVQTPATPAGTFSDPATPGPTWTAPQVTAATSFQLGVTVSDGKSSAIRRSVTILVRPRPPTNRPPVITAGTPSASPPSVSGSVPVRLTLAATDADDDQLTYSWSQEPATPVGIFSNLFVSSPTWTSPVVSATTRFTLRVTVSDGRGGSVQGEIGVDVAPPGNQNNSPMLVSGPSTSASTINSQQSVNLTVTASDADGDTLSYSWGQTPTSPAGVFSNATAANPSWTAPTVTTETTFQLRVTVSDGQGGVATGTVSVTVRAPANRSPTISQAASANPTMVTGAAAVQLAVTATDPDGDTLTYAWTQTPATPAGNFSSTSIRNPTWTSPEVTTTTRFTLGVTITDGRGGSVQSQVPVDVEPPIPANNPPVLTAGPTANPTTLDYQQVTTLSLTATDADGDSLTYAWTQQPATPAGTFSNPSAATPTWTAPRVTTNTAFQLRVAVSDGRGGSANGSASVNVNAFVNSPPTIDSGPSASSTTVDEQQSITLSVTASDANGDSLTYAWTQTAPASPVGTFSSASVANPTWTAPNVTANGTYTLRVTISDGQGGSVQGSINITVQKVNQPPVVSANITGPSTLVAGNTGTFSITASDPDGDTLTYAWSQTDPATPQGTFVGSTTGSSAQWYSPALGTQTSFTLSVSVTDGQSTPVVRTITLPVTVPRYAADIQTIWDGFPCTSCHGSSGNLSLGASSYTNLVNAPSFGACVPGTRVIPGDPDASVLMRKISGTACGDRMPQSDPAYFDRNPGLLIRIRSWILAGAAND